MRIIPIIILLILSISLVSAQQPIIEVREMSAIEGFLAGLSIDSGTSLYVAGGGFSDEGEVLKGDMVDITVQLRFASDGNYIWTQDGSDSAGHTSKILLYFVDESLLLTPALDVQKSYIGTFYLSKRYYKGDWIEATFKDIPTSKLSDSYCGKGIKFVGHHYVARGSVGSSFSWQLDTPDEYITSRKSGGNFFLDCQEDNPCGDESVFLGYECLNDGRRWAKYRTPYVSSTSTDSVLYNGVYCKLSYTAKPCSSGYVCNAGKCTETDICDEGDNRCDLNGLVSQVCYNNAWEYEKACESGKCEDGICAEDSEIEASEVITGDNDADTQTSTGCEGKECSKDYVCPSGDMLLQCVDGCYQATLLEQCPPEEQTSTTTTTTATSGGTPTIPTISTDTNVPPIYTGSVVTTSKFDLFDWMSDNPVIAALIAGVVVYGGLYLFNNKNLMKKIRGKRR